MDSVNTRDRIKAAALPLFAAQGFAATSIAAIERAAGLAPRAGAFYRHFDSKEALFEELAAERQQPYLRLIEEARLTASGRAFEQRANGAMLEALMAWVAGKPAAEGLDAAGLAALTLEIFGSWLFYLSKRQQGIELAVLDRDALLEDWAGRWAGLLDRGA